jgi:putative Mn2+ efflux pump MntP
LIRLHKKKQDITTETLVNTVWVSTFLALVLTIPALVVFLGIYFTTANLLVGAIVGFGLHFVALAFSDRISKKLTEILS